MIKLRPWLLPFTLAVLPALVAASELPRIVERNGRYALFVDGAPFLMLAAQVNNSSAWPAQMPKVWPTLDDIHVNTVEVPVYWQQFEPREGVFDTSVVDFLLQQAREHRVRLVLLWFATWKNNGPSYTPDWVKLDFKRFPRVTGKDGRTMDSMSPFGENTLQADRTAFAFLMRHLKAADPEHTVILVQVENEAGLWGGTRDFSPVAEKLFRQAVPKEVAAAMQKGSGTWEELFGPDADEYFHAWAVSSYIGKVAEAGKAEYPLPMYCNAALRDPLHPSRPPGMESGAPTDDVLPIWKAAAPQIDALEPDIYMPEYEKYTKVLELYAQPSNPLFVPETGNSPAFAHYFFAALGAGAFGFAPFGMDRTGYSNYPLGAKEMDEQTIAPFALNYAIAGPMQRQLAKLIFEGKVQGVAEPPSVHNQVLHFGKWDAIVEYGLPSFGTGTPAPGNLKRNGEALVAMLGPDEFLVTGAHARVHFELAEKNSGKSTMLVKVEEGAFNGDEWKTSYLWNGDQTDYGVNFTELPQVLRVSLATY